jgi:hypothetical protein
MTTRYTAALAEIRSILSGRTQADPMLEAQDVWEELTCYPVPSLRTVRRLMDKVRSETGFVRRGQTARLTATDNEASAHGQKTTGGDATTAHLTGHTFRMTNAEIRHELDDLKARADAYDRRAVEIGEDTVAVLDTAARREGTNRHFIAAFAMLKYVRERYPDLAPPDSTALGASLN